MVWAGMSDAYGLVSIPWGAEERANGNVATFAPNSSYTLKQTAANTYTVLPAGAWTVKIGRDNSVTWTVVTSEDGKVDRTLAITSSGETAHLGDTFGVSNDVKPTLTFQANGKTAKLSDKSSERTDTIDFTATETSHTYTIKETDPTWDSHVFRNWATMEKKPTAEDGSELGEKALIEKGYFEYEQKDEIVFFRGTAEEENAKGYSKGDLNLYAQWDEVVCKITDRSGTLLYFNGSPAVYGSLEDGFAAYNAATAYSFTYTNGSRATARMIEMLIPAYTLESSVTLARGKTVMLTTAPTTDTDGYAYTGEAGTACVITRGENCDTSMIVNKSNLTLMNIVLDGDARKRIAPIVCDGGIVNNAQTSAVLTISDDAILCYSRITGNGAAVNAIAGTTVYLTGGTITNNSCVESGSGAGIYLAEGSRLYLSGEPSFGGTDVDSDGNIKGTDGNFAATAVSGTNGQKAYAKARQDIFLAGYADTDATSIVVNGPVTAAPGSIWVWANDDDATHYKMLTQFATLDDSLLTTDKTAINTAKITKEQLEATYLAFRNARADADTECGGDYLTGQEGDTIGLIKWTGGFDFVFKKIDGFGEALEGATFTLYTSTEKDGAIVPAMESDGTTLIPYMQMGDSGKAAATSKPVGTTSDKAVTIRVNAGTAETPDVQTHDVYGAGLMKFIKIPPGVYFMQETTFPTVKDTEEHYRAVEPMYMVDLNGKGYYDIYVPDVDSDGNPTWVKDDAHKAPTETLKIGSDEVVVPKALNVLPATQAAKVVLRKVDKADHTSLEKAEFTLYYVDRETILKTDLKTGANGVIYVGRLPYGVYYLHETSVPTGYAGGVDGLWFSLAVDETGLYKFMDGYHDPSELKKDETSPAEADEETGGDE